MKLKTRKVASTRKNIFGKQFVVRTYYVVYRPLFFGLFRCYLHLHSYHLDDGSTIVSWVNSSDIATRFDTQSAAEEIIRDIEANPNKYFSIV